MFGTPTHGYPRGGTSKSRVVRRAFGLRWTQTATSTQKLTTMDVDEDGGGVAREITPKSEASEAERFALLRGAVKDAPTDYGAHLAFVGYLRSERPGSLDLLKAREE